MRITVARSSSDLLSGFLALIAFAAGANAQLLHRYDFTADANDTVGTAHGTLVGGASISGGALNTDGGNGAVNGQWGSGGPMVSLDASAVAGLSGAFSIETWFQCTSGWPKYDSLFAFSDNTQDNYLLGVPVRGYSPWPSGVGIKGAGGNTSDQPVVGPYLDDNTPHQAVLTYDGTTFSWYVDGALADFSGLPATLNNPGFNLSTLTYIGINGGSPWADPSLTGSTYDFRIYGQALTTAQVAGLHTLGADAVNVSIVDAIATVASNPVVVDPGIPMSTGGGNFATEWNTPGDLEGWSGVNATVATDGSSLTGTSTTNDSRVQITGIAGGPDLDLGWNDFLDLRIQVPASYHGPVQVFYGTSTTGGFSADRVLTIPADVIPDDGAFHTYRIELGLETLWRSTLTDLRIDPVDGAGTTGMAFAIDFIRVGDEPGAPVYQTITTVEMPVAGGSTPAGAAHGAGQTVYSMESKRFRIVWNDAVTALNGWTADMPHGTLRNAEEVWQVHAKKLGYREPCFTMEDPTGGGGTIRGKVNISTWHAGYWAGGDWDGSGNRCRFNATPDGLRVDPPTWVLPHELMHDFQFVNNQAGMPGAWYEAHADYATERWLEHYQVLFPNTTSLATEALKNAHIIMGDGRDQYLKWLPFLYMDSNPDDLPDLGEGTSALMWQQNPSGQNPFNLLDTLAPTTGKKDLFGHMAQHGATMNYPARPMMRNIFSSDPLVTRSQYTDLVQRSDEPDWWRVPYEKAPQQGAYTIHELVPAGSGDGRVVEVDFHGLPDSARGADWRAGFTIVKDDGSERYSSLWNSGSHSVTLAADENKLYLCVAGTPDTFGVTDGDESINPYRSAAGKARFPYEVQMTGATPKQRDNGGISGLLQHANGGGWKSGSATVAATAHIGPNARVLDSATVGGNARIEDFAVVQGDAQVLDEAVVSGHGWVTDNAIVRNNAKVRDWAMVRGTAIVDSSARVLENADVRGSTTVTGTAVVKGSAWSDFGTISGNAIVDGNYAYGRDVVNGFVTGHLPFVGVPDNFITPLPTGFYASYDFANAHDSRIIDTYGVTDSFTVGSPAWISADAKRDGFLRFDGTSQHVNLDRSVADLRDFTFTAWVKPLGGEANQAVLWLGASSTRRLYFTPDNGAGHAQFSIVNGGAEQTLTSAAPLTPGIWTHVAITLNGTTGTLYLNGASAASEPITIRPDQLLAANTATGLQHNHLAKSGGDVLPRFNGALDDVGFHSAALSAGDIAAMQPATTVTAAGTLYVDLRASDASAGTTTWTNIGTLGDFSRNGSPSKTTVANIPAVSFNGTNQAYTGPNTIADLDGGSDRSIEVWAYNPTLADEETIVSWAHRWTDRRNMAFNFGSNPGWGAATHWSADIGWGSNVPGAGSWHHLVYTFDGSGTGKVYVDGMLANTATYSGAIDTFASEPINIACQRESANGTRSVFFSGSLNTVRIHGGVLSAAQVAANHSLGPAGAPGNTPPTADAQSLSLDQDTSLPITLTGGDANGDPLDFLITTPPAHGTLSGTLPALTYTPAPGYRGADSFTFNASDGAANSPPATVTLAVNATYTPVEIWRQANFGSDWDNPAVAGDLVDVEHDGLVNLIEYILGTDPNALDAAEATRISTQGGKLSLVFTRNTAATDVTISVMATDDITAAWTELARSENGAAFVPIEPGAVVNETGSGEIKDVEAIDIHLTTDPAHPRRFMRLKVNR